MSDPAPPNHLITQVSRKDDKDGNNNSNGAAATGANQIEVQSHEGRGNKPSLLQRLCCFMCNKRNRHTQYNNNDDDNSIPDMGAEGHLLQPSTHGGKKTLVLDLDETLVHSSFKPIPNPDFIIPVEIEDQVHKVYVVKRPHVDQFLKSIGPTFEVVVFTASLSKYADPVLDLLDTYKVVDSRLFREACTCYKGNYVKDLNRLGRPIKHSLIVDNSPSSYLFHPENAIPVESWFDDENDTELLDLLPLLDTLAKCDDVRVVLEEARRTGRLKTHHMPLQ